MYTIDELAYKLYKTNWVNSRISPEVQLDTIREWYKYSNGEGLSTYIEEEGYHGALYVCYEEFMDAEFRDEEFMKELLKDPELIDQYEEFIKGSERDR